MKIKNRKPIGNMRFQRWVCLRSEAPEKSGAFYKFTIDIYSSSMYALYYKR